jgi:large repetitive protein
MKKNLLILDLFLINIKIILSEGLDYFDVFFSQMHFTKRESTFINFCKIQNSTALLLLFIFLGNFSSHSQPIGTDFSARLSGGNIKVKGDVTLIGNTILTPRNQALPFNGAGNNNSLDAVYLDIDGDGSTFSSSSADLAINNSCKKIVWAGLYWSAIYPNGVSTITSCFNCGTPPENDWNVVKFKVPGSTTYTTITANKADPKEVIFKGNDSASPFVFNDAVYVCFKEVTSLLTSLANADGTYTVADLRATTGQRRGGAAGGWTLVVIYESPTLTSKFISVYDGARMTNVDPGPNRLLQVDIPISGFQTLPAPFPVNAKMGVAALDGDYDFTGDGLGFREGIPPPGVPPAPANDFFTSINNSLNPANNFFNATITNNNSHVANRNPNSQNNLGFDIDQLVIPNPLNGVIHNDATQGTLRLTTSSDGYAAFVATFAIDIIEPNILLTKQVFDNAAPPNDTGDKDVTLGQQLNYVIGFQNQGNDNATSFTITDTLPINTVFIYPTDIDVASLPPGTTHTYNAATRTIVFTIPNNLVEINDPRYEIRFKVKVVDSCNQLSDACSNIIQNIALSQYSGTFNRGNFGDQSLSSYTTCNIGIPQATNFLVGIDDCQFTKNEVLCGTSVVIAAANGYNSYQWSTAPFNNAGVTTGTILGTNQTLTVTNPATYYVYNTAIAPCLSITEAVTVTRFGTIIANPVIPYADQVVTCPNDGKSLPNIFLCGAEASRFINTAISDGSTIIWEKLNEGSCVAVTNTDCANEGTTCTWTQVATGPDYTATISGQFRLTLNYPGGCFNRFYFNVYKNLLNPTETHRDIICSTNGNITVRGVGSGYEYSISNVNGTTPTTYQPGNSFAINTAGLYTVFIRQVGIATNPCVFTIPNIQIRQRNFTITPTVTQPLCFGELGNIKVAANDVDPQYNYYIYDGATLVNSVGPIIAGDYTFANLTPGKTYRVRVTTSDGCDQSELVTIVQPSSALSASAVLDEPLTSCSDGKIVINAQGGTAPYFYFINGSPTFQTSNEIVVTSPGIYDIVVVDSNNCSTTTSITVAAIEKPIYTITNTNSNCYNDNAQININLTNANGNSLSYSIDNGVTFQINPTFSNLPPGTYNVVVRHGISYTPSNGIPDIKYCSDPAEIITITGPALALTASGVIGELAGCGPSGEGLARITNAQGGTAPYQYSFDGGSTWQASNEKYVMPGTYTLVVRDALGCTVSIPGIILDPKPTDPTIQVADAVFNCDGTATTTVTVTNASSINYTYEYYLDNNPNTPITNNVFSNVPSGNHNVSVKYNVVGASTYSNLVQEDFGRGGYTTIPGISPRYCYENETLPRPAGYVACYANAFNDTNIDNGEYTVASSIKTSFGTAWLNNPKDHTSPADPLGRFLCVNVGSAVGVGGIMYSKPIYDVIPNQDVIISLWAENLIRSSNPAFDDPYLTIQLVRNLDLVTGTGDIVAQTSEWRVPKTDKWEELALTLNPGTDTSNLSFVIRSYNIEDYGNDVLIDDISVRQIPKSCLTPINFPIVIDANQAFTAAVIGHKDITCAGANDGEITIAVQNFATTGFYYSLDGAAFVLSATSPLTIGGLSAGPHSVRVQYDLSASPCLFTLPQAITAPTPLTVTASVTTLPTCSTGATITAVGGGGTPAYQYELRNTIGGAVVRAFQTNAQFINVSSGNYTVFARDANLCVTSVGAPVNVTAPIAPVATVASSSDLCHDSVNQSTLVVDVTGGTGPFAYSLDGGASQNGNTFTNVGVGTHTIIVTDSKNCSSTISDIIIEPQLQLNATLTQDLTCLNDASINAVVVGGNGAPYTYSGTLNGTPIIGLIDFPYTATLPGTYVFTVTDSQGCSATSNIITVSPKTVPTITTSKTDISCNNANDGTITVSAANGFTSAYTYAIKLSTATLFTTQTTNVFSNLPAGTYNVKVIDSKGCESAVTDVIITNPDPITANATATAFSCSPTNTKQSATITVTPSGGTLPYSYSYNNGTSFTTNNTLTVNDNGSSQSFNIIVKDANGCLSPVELIILAPLNPPTDLSFLSNVISCAVTSTTVTATNGVGALTYEIISPVGAATSNTTGIFSGLVPNTYVFKVTDANGCFYTESYTVTPVIPIAIVGQNISNVLCKGDNTGLARYTVSGFSSTGNYAVVVTPAVPFTNVGNVITLSNLTFGTYNVRVTDNTTGCTANTDVIITEPATPLSLSIVSNANANCNSTTAIVKVAASGGTTGYLYSFVPDGSPAGIYSSSDTGNLNVATNANWDVYVKDANGCTAKIDVTIAQDPVPTVTASVTNQCNASGSTFQIQAVGANGVAPYTYTINSGVLPSPADTFTVAAGSYTITVRDANGCTSTTSVIVNQALTATAVLTKDLDCSASPDGIITINVSGGKPGYTYRVSSDGGATYTTTGLVGNVFTTAVAGTFQFEVTDSNVPTCSKITNSITINPIVYPEIFSLTETQSIKCNGDNTGRIQVAIDATKGVAPFTYSIDGINYQSSNVFTGLTAGNYTITVKDSKGCINTVPANITISQPDLISFDLTKVDITCNNPGGSSLGSITVSNVLGGTAPFKYFITNNFGDAIAGNPYTAILTGREDHTFPIINYGIYTINVIDANGCSLTEQITMASPPDDLNINVTTLASNCTTGGTAIVQAISLVGSGNYEFGILETNISPYTTTWLAPDVVNGNTRTFTNLVPGVTYTFVVHDLTTDCYFVKAADQPIAPASSLTATVTPANVTCVGDNNGSATFTLSGADSTTTSVDYQIFRAFSNVAVAGTSGNISVAGVPPFTATVPSPGALSPGQYYIKFIENGTGSFNGCQSASAIFEIKESSINLSVTAAVIKNENCNNLGIINALAKDGTAPYMYMINSSASAPAVNDPNWNVSSTFNVAAGSYYVHAKDAYNCIQPSAEVVLTKDPEPVIALAIVDKCAAEGAFQINVDLTTAGIAPYTIRVNGGASQNVASFPYTISGLNSGLQTVRVIDANGCFSEKTITIDKKLSVNVALTKELDCTVSPDAVITLNVADGLFTASDATPDFTYEVNINNLGYVAAPVPFANDSRTATYPASTAGTYQFRITDLNNCSVETTVVTVNPKVDPTATTTFTQPSCPTVADGTLTITASVGILPYEYSISGGTSWQSLNTFTSLGAGLVNYLVRDAKQCLFSGSETITDPVSLNATAAVTDFACSATNVPQMATVTINVTAGTGTAPYTYNFDGSTNYYATNLLYVIDNGTIQTINYSVKDANSCIFNGSTTVNPYQKITDITFVATAPTCLVPTSDVTLTIVGGYTPIAKYEIISPIVVDNGTNPVFNLLVPNTYLFKVTDANGCSFEKSFAVNPVTNITVSGLVTSEVTCFGLTNGSAEFTVANFTGTYTALLTTGIGAVVQSGNKVTISGLAFGNYTVTVTDDVTGCSANASVTITQPAAALSSTSVATNINCNNDTATVTITATGGTVAYKYAIARVGDPAPATTSFVLSNQLVVDTNNGADMNWIVYVTDANGCSTTNTQTIQLDTKPIITSAIATQCPSPTGTYTITVTATGFTTALEYSIDGVSFQTSNILTVNAAVTYTITVKDANGCLSAPTTVTILQPLTLNAAISTIPNCNDADGEVTLTATGGTIPSSYEYSNDGTNYVTTNVFGSLAPSLTPYTFYVRDAGTLCVKSVTISIEPAAVITNFALTSTPVTCNGGNDGTITATLATPAAGINDNPVYLYSLSGTENRPAQPSNQFTGLAAGTYTVDVISARGCTATASIDVAQPTVINVGVSTVVQFGCIAGTNGTNFASITASNVTGGSGIYTVYEFFKDGALVQRSASNSYIESNVLGGNFTINVFDDKGCSASTLTPIVINPFISLDKVNVAVTTAITCTNDESISVTVDTTGGAPALLNYTVSGTGSNTYNQTNTTGLFTGLTIGNYILTVQNPETNCSIQSIHYVNDPNTFQLNAVKTNDVVCFGSNEGAVELTIVDNLPPNNAGSFSYVVTSTVLTTPITGNSPDAGPFTLSGLTAGLYNVTATLLNSPFCSATTSFTINQPTADLVISETHTEITCVPGNDGSISVSATGGWPGAYQYELVGPVNVAYGSQTYFDNLPAGSYTVNVRDSGGCVRSVVVTLNLPTPIAVTAVPSTTLLSCIGDKSATIIATSVTGGQGSNYLYTLNYLSLTPAIANGPQTSNTFTGLGAGTYSITVTDGWGCSGTSATIVIAEPTRVQASLVKATSQTCTVLSTLTLSATGGTAPYTYSPDNVTYSIATFASSVTISVPVGTHRYYVRDANGCTSFVSNDITIDPLPALTVKLDYVTPTINCKGETSGVIVVTANGGLGNYIYTLQDGSGNPIVGAIQTTPGNFTQLVAGTYRVFVQSGDCSTTSAQITITEPDIALSALAVPTNATCNGLNNGKIVVTATGGTGTIKYAISPDLNQFFDTGIFDNLAPGSYDIITQDQNGCFIYETGILISEPTPVNAAVIAGTLMPEVCFGDQDGAFSITVSGGTAPYSVRIDSGTFTTGTATQTDFDFTGLSGGMHTVYIRDANFCSFEFDVPLPESVKLDPQVSVDYGCNNNAPTLTVTVTIDPSITNPADVDYALDGVAPYQASNVFTNVAPGVHYITARHTNGCEKVTPNFLIEEVLPLTLVLTEGGLNEIVATATGGAGGYQYALNGESMGNKNTFIYYRSGDYTVTVTDANGCVATATRYFEFIDIKIPNVFTPNGDGDNDVWAPTNTINYPDLIFFVFDRYGRKVGTYREGQFWDGRYNGNELPTGDYWYIIKLRNEADAREFVGHFTLYR